MSVQNDTINKVIDLILKNGKEKFNPTIQNERKVAVIESLDNNGNVIYTQVFEEEIQDDESKIVIPYEYIQRVASHTIKSFMRRFNFLVQEQAFQELQELKLREDLEKNLTLLYQSIVGLTAVKFP